MLTNHLKEKGLALLAERELATRALLDAIAVATGTDPNGLGRHDMGRELRRVPLDFDWPLKKRWHGFLNPHYKKCPEEEKGNCHAGMSSAGQWLEEIARFIALIGEDAEQSTPAHIEHNKKTGRLYPHPYIREWSGYPTFRGEDGVTRMVPLNAELASLLQGMADGESFRLGGMANYTIGRSLIKACGQDPETWGRCPVCKGSGQDPAFKEAYEAWQKTPPPEGPGYQLWETTTEGSPMSAVYPTEAEFIEYLVGEGYTMGAAKAFCVSGWVPCAVILIDANGEKTLYPDVASAELEDDE